MKRITALLLTLMLTFVSLTACAGTLKVTSPDTKSGELTDLAVGWEKLTDYFTFIATWSNDGDMWEAAVTGLPEKLTTEQITLLISAALQGNQAVISGPALIDVEKFSSKIPLSYANLLAISAAVILLLRRTRPKDC